jgi:hypothetical protein
MTFRPPLEEGEETVRVTVYVPASLLAKLRYWIPGDGDSAQVRRCIETAVGDAMARADSLAMDLLTYEEPGRV